MPLFFNASENKSLQIVEALYRGGVKLIEYTNRGPEALANFTAIKKLAIQNFPDLYLGAGTIKNAEQADLFINAGADFLISPAFDKDIYTSAKNKNILWIPGCMTPTEILQAEKLGIKLIKIFPGNVVGPAFVCAVKELFPLVQFMPTGGVDSSIENLKSWFKAGVAAVGMGSKLIKETISTADNYKELSVMVQQVLKDIDTLKTSY